MKAVAALVLALAGLALAAADDAHPDEITPKMSDERVVFQVPRQQGTFAPEHAGSTPGAV